MKKGDVFSEGLELNFFHPDHLSTIHTPELKGTLRSVARKALSILMLGWNHIDKASDFVSSRVFKAIFVKKDPELIAYVRDAFQEGLNYVYIQLKDTQLTELQQHQAELYISNCLSYLSVFNPTPDETFDIPQYVDGKWELVKYQVVPIELTPTTGFESFFIYEEDRVFAYGLEPLPAYNTADPHLIFMGTTYPAGQGHHMQVYSDLEAFETAGKQLYRTGKANIINWLDSLHRKPHVCGLSLGGALSLLLSIDEGKRLARVDALNPAGLYFPWRKSRYDHWDSFTEAEKPPVYIQKQASDVVSSFGVWKKDWTVLQVTPPADNKGPNGFIDHALNYAGLAHTRVTIVDTEEDNKERWLRNLLLYTYARSLFYYVALVPFHYAIRPFVYYAMEHKLQMAFTLSVAILFPYIPVIAAPILIAMTVLLALYYLQQPFTHAVSLFKGTHQPKPATCHSWYYSRQHWFKETFEKEPNLLLPQVEP